MKTADLTEFGRWKTDRPETAFALLRLSRPPEGAGEAELRGRLEELGAFLGRFSLSSQAAEANLESAEIKLTLAQMAQAAGQSSEKCQSHLQAAAAQLKEAAVDPRLAAEAGVTQERLGTLQKACAPEPAKPAPTPGLSREERLRSAEQLYERGDNKEALERLKRLLREYPDSKAAKVLREKVETSLELMGR